MAQSKGSKAIIILLLLIIFGVIGAWFYTSQNDGQNDENTQTEEEIGTFDTDIETQAETTAAVRPSYGTKGTVFDKPVDPVLGERGIGDKNAPVQVREFYSLTCNHCANFHNNQFQVLKEKYIDTGKLYFIYEEFPLNGPALYGSMIARCMPEERYADFVALLLKEQEKWAFGGDFKSALKQNAALAGMSEEDFDACYNNKELQQAIATNIQKSSEVWNIRSTPTFVFNNGEKIIGGSETIEAFESVITELSGMEVSDEQKRIWSKMANEEDHSGHDHGHDH